MHESMHLADTYLTLLLSVARHQELVNTCKCREKSTSEAANLVGLSLPKTYRVEKILQCAFSVLLARHKRQHDSTVSSKTVGMSVLAEGNKLTDPDNVKFIESFFTIDAFKT
ncbi:unnamed protein product [Rodentolepis nana]|uniref:Dimerisation domain-containing protein n=1 Tax=Rodentolepis nana TaxID=102285 RepID=A0A0R3T7G6_RODNA|nr:unnamed protein product [Rodentolepis nana]